MALSNRDRVGRAFEALGNGLGPWVDRMMRARSPHKDRWLDEWARVDKVTPASINVTDPQFALKVVAEAWDPVFKDRGLNRSHRNLVFELRDTRNRWAHNEAFSFDDAYRALDSIERLLTAIDAREVDEVGAAKAELMRSAYEDQVKRQAAKVASTQQTLLDQPVAGLSPWRVVAPPHDDVAAGKFQMSEFAADLHLVHTEPQRAPLEYRDPAEFFSRTFLTQGMRDLLVTAARRVTGGSGDPIIDLQTNFGGGKTHSLIALYHLFSGTPVHDLGEEVQSLLADAGVADQIRKVPRAVLVGTRIAPGQAETKPDGTVVRTMWGELAWQLGQQAGVDAFGLVADADRTSSNPGVALRRVFELVGPCLILVDEWVAYARQLRGDDAHVGGTFDTHFSFAQALTEAVGDVPGVLLVVSIPASISDDEDEAASELEIGGRDGYVALQQLRNVIGRRGMSWRPASVEESFEIVRRRLFKPLDGDALQRRDITARAFFDFYSRHSSEFPPACKDKPYLERLKRAYPIHPELFDRLYDDWSTLERFQRTRGVLRLMASVIHALWTANDQSPLILPGNLPLDVASVATELTNKLDDTWKPILDADIDGEHALATELDRLSNDIGKHSAARRVARTVFLGSAPLVRSSRRGMETARIRLGCAMPGDKLSVFSDALNRLADRSTYLNVEAGNRYWYSVNPTLARMARERAERFATDERHVVEAEIVARLEQEKQPGRRGAFAAVHVAPDSSAEVADEPEARLVILGPRQPHAAKGPSAAAQTALDVVLNRGGAQREFRNALVFLAPDSRRIGELEAAVADYLAWRSIRDDAGILNLDDSQKQQVAVRFESADNTVVGRLRETYTQVLVPEQPEPTGPITLHTVTVSRPEQLAADVSKKLVAEGMLHTAFAYESLRALHLDGPLAAVWEQGHVSVRELYGYMARYPYLRRLADLGVLTATVAAGTATTDWEQRAFAVASAVTADGRYLDLTAGAHPNGLDATWLVVRPDRARAQLDQMAAARATVATSADVDLGTTVVDLDGASADTPSAPTRFRARIPVDRERPQRAVDGIVADIVAHLNKPGTDLSITVVIEAHRADGFDDGVQRTLAENASVMKAQLAEFE